MYDWSINLDPAFRANAAKMMAATVNPRDRVLDVGIGTGLLAELGAERAGEYTGVDYSAAMLAAAARKMSKRHQSNVALHWGDATSLPFPSVTFDCVVSSFVLPHFTIEEKQVVLNEMARVLTPGGRLGLFLAQGEVASLFATRDQLELLCANAGFTQVQISDHDDVYRIITAKLA